MIFKEKANDSHSKLSKAQSQDHYAAVLESLAPKSVHQQQQEKSLSKISRDKSSSQLPPKSNYDNSKIDLRNYQIAE